MKLGLVFSDLHVGSGQKKGEINIYDDFRDDERFTQILERYTTGRHEDDDVLLVLNGDIFDLLKVSVNGAFPDAITERLAVTKLEQCLTGHPDFTRALGKFLRSERRRIVFIPGNHDAEFHFPGVQRFFRKAVSGDPTHPRIHVESERPYYAHAGVQFHHGHQFEAMHAFDFDRVFLTRGHREPILNLPWGSMFVIHVLNKLLEERQYVDKVMPFWPLVAGGLALDTRFTVKLLAACGVAFGRARLNPQFWSKRPFEKVTRFIQRDIGFFSGLERFAEKILDRPDASAVFMGHTHLEMVKSFPGDKVYVNTGTWMPMVSLMLGNLGQTHKRHFGLVRWSDDAPPRASLMRWHGSTPLEEEVLA